MSLKNVVDPDRAKPVAKIDEYNASTSSWNTMTDISNMYNTPSWPSVCLGLPTCSHQQKTTLLAGILCVLYVPYVSYKVLIGLAEGCKSDKYLIRHIRHCQVKLFFADD